MFWVYLRQAARGYDVQYISVSVQSLSHVWLFATPWAAAHQASLSITNSWNLLNSSPSSQWYHPTFSPADVPFSSCLQSFPESESFPMNQLFASGGQSTGTSTLASVLPMNILQHHSSKTSILWRSGFFMVQLSHPFMTTGKTIALTRWNFVGKVMSLLLICCLDWSELFFQEASVF